MDIQQARALFGSKNSRRIQEIVARHEKIEAEIEKLQQERQALDAEFRELIGSLPAVGGASGRSDNRTRRKCSLCGQPGHIVARRRTPDGRPTCPTYPNGGPVNAATPQSP